MKMMKLWMLVAVAAMGFTACSKDATEEVAARPEADKVTIRFGADTEDDTRVTIADKLQIWQDKDAVGIFLTENSVNEQATATVDQNTVEFTAEVFDFNAGDLLYAYYPYNTSNGDMTTADLILLAIPNEQLQNAADEYDGSNNPMVSVPLAMTEAGESGEITLPALWFRPLGSIAQFKLYTTATDNDGEEIEYITFTADKPLAGDFLFDLTAVTKEGELTIDGCDQNIVSTVLANAAALPGSKEEAVSIYMVVASGTYSGTIEVKTNKATYTKQLANEITFNRAKVKPLSLDLATAESDKQPDTPKIYEYQLITTMDQLEDGEYVLAGFYNDKYYALTNAGHTSLSLIDGAAITVTVDFITETDATGYVWIIKKEDNSAFPYSISNGESYLTGNAKNTNLPAYSSTLDSAQKWNIEASDYGFKVSGQASSTESTKRGLIYRGDNNKFGGYAISNIGKEESYTGIYLFKKVEADPNKKVLSIDSFTATLNADKTAVEFDGTYTSNYDEEPEWSISVSKDGTAIGTIGDVIGVDGEIAADDYTVTEDGTYTFTLTATIGGEVIASKTAKDIYVRNNDSWILDTFSNYSVSTLSSYKQSGTFKSSASTNITWSYTKCGNPTQANTDKNSLSSDLTVSNDATYIAIGEGGTLSTTIPGGITNLKFNVLTSSSATLTITITCNGQTIKTETVAKSSKMTKEITDIDCQGQDAVIKFSTNKNRATIGDVAWK